eukprot:SAG31_NODE_6881_length_1861_cov_1.975028_1_plen_86_part_00
MSPGFLGAYMGDSAGKVPQKRESNSPYLLLRSRRRGLGEVAEPARARVAGGGVVHGRLPWLAVALVLHRASMLAAAQCQAGGSAY